MSWRLLMAALGLVLLLAGCIPWKPDDGSRVYKSSYEVTPDGYYRVRKGDTLHAIAFHFGQDWRDIAAWNSIRSPYTIYPDQKLKLSGPARRSASTAPARPAGKSTTRESTPSASASKPAATTPAPSRSKTPTSTDPNKWLWPTEGRVVSTFRANDPTRNGIEIGGKEGQPVRATASGEVVYSGNGLIGYGELIIVKHSERLLSAYAHNRKRLVAEGQRVKAGERIAEMGRNDRNKAILHFEIRLNGSPRNPLEYLPGR